LFNTSYIPYLQYVGAGVAGIFLVNLANNGAQALLLPMTARACEGTKAERIVLRSTWARASGYAGVLGLSLLPLVFGRAFLSGNQATLAVNALAYGILGAGVAFYGTASSLLLFRSLEGRSAGSLLGVNSAAAAVAAVLGSATSGVLTHLYGYSVTFGVAALAMASAVPLWILGERAYRDRQTPVHEHPAS
jgi:predicted MFS family arabinose efflux permease